MAHRVLGRGSLPLRAPDQIAICAGCGINTHVLRVAKLLPPEVMDREHLGRETLACIDCAWGWFEFPVKEAALFVRGGDAQWVHTRQQVRQLLARPIGPEMAMAVPTIGGRSLIPQLRWGYITTERGLVTWNEEACAILRTASEAVGAGVDPDDLGRFVPQFDTVFLHGDRALGWWEVFRTWQGTPLFDVVVRVCHDSPVS